MGSSMRRDDGSGRLPDFLIIGAPRSGTTTLAAYLDADPNVFVAPQKELLFFDRHFAKGVAWYRAQFAAAGDTKFAGEATPSYMYDDEAVRRMTEVVPDARLIVILREPVSRAYSSYWFRVGLGRESRTFEEAVEDELRGRPSRRPFPEGLAASTYLPALERVAARYPRTALHVMLLEDLKNDPGAALQALRDFLGLEGPAPPLDRSANAPYRLRVPRLRRAMLRRQAWRRLPFGLAERIDRWNRVPFAYPPIDPQVRDRLVRHFAPHNVALAAWLGRDLSEWSDPA